MNPDDARFRGVPGGAGLLYSGSLMKAIGICLLGLTLAACQSPPPVKDKNTERARFLLESDTDKSVLVTLPMSGVQISVLPKPVFTEYDIVHVDIAHIELGDCLVFQFTPAAARDLQRITTENPGRRLVLTLGGVAFGARRIDKPLLRGTLFVYVETTDAALPALAASLNATAAALHSPAAKQ
jgi:hypothetical protein